MKYKASLEYLDQLRKDVAPQVLGEAEVNLFNMIIDPHFSLSSYSCSLFAFTLQELLNLPDKDRLLLAKSYILHAYTTTRSVIHIIDLQNKKQWLRLR